MKASVRQYDPLVLIATLVLVAFGLVVMTSASAEIGFQNHQQPLYFFYRQLFFVALSLAMMLLLSRIDIDQLARARWLFLAAALALLVLVLVPGIGYSVNGSQRWINLGFVRVHASDFARTFALLFCAAWLSSRITAARRPGWGELIPMLVLMIVFSSLMLAQPDFGAVVVFGVCLFGMMFLAGMRILPMVAVLAVGVAPLAWLVLSSGYRLRRLQGFLDPFADPYDSGFQLVQSLIAVGSGGTGGVGLGNSVQKMSFLPEAHNDFIFSILAEEFGFIGIVFVVSLYLLLVLRILILAWQARRRHEHFCALICAGTGVWLAAQALINIGVATALLPTKGISLPMVSYGGANMMVSLAQIGLVLAVFRHLHRRPGAIKSLRVPR